MKEKIAVLMGGHSLERDVSLHSGKRVAQALKKLGYRVAQIDVDEHVVHHLRREKPDLAFIVLHGKFGEDGTIQELLEIMGIPYTGAGVLSSMIGMDKACSKEIFRLEGIPTPDFYALSTGAIKEMGASAALKDVIRKIGLPLVVKPSAQGSALGIKFVNKEEDLPSALLGALSYDDKVILEKFIKGTEVAVSVLGNARPRALPPVEIVPKTGFFDFQSMYTMGMTEYFVPARLASEMIKQVEKMAVRAYQALKCKGAARVDFIVSKKDKIPYVIELNTIPGMTETSLLPMAAAEAGLTFEELVDRLVKIALKSA